MPATDPSSCEQTIRDYVNIFESLSIDSVDDLISYFCDDARFVDPFNSVIGKTAIKGVFIDMFKKTQHPHFVVDDVYIKNRSAMLSWTFYFQFKNKIKTIEIQGSSKIIFDENSKVKLHKDFWDPCQGLYENIPLLSIFFRKLRKRLEVRISK